MKLQVKKRKKAAVVYGFTVETPRLRTLLNLQQLCIPGGAVIAIAFISVSLMSIQPVMPHDSPEDVVRELVSIFSVACTVFLAFVAAHFVVKSALTKRQAPSLLERSDEVIRVTDKGLLYTFRLKSPRGADARRFCGENESTVAITIDFDKISELSYNKDIGRLKFCGEFMGQYAYEDENGMQSKQTKWEKEFIIFDYFTPSLSDIVISEFRSRK